MGQTLAHGLLTADITDREQIRETEEDLLIVRTTDLGLVLQWTKALAPVVEALVA